MKKAKIKSKKILKFINFSNKIKYRFELIIKLITNK